MINLATLVISCLVSEILQVLCWKNCHFFICHPYCIWNLRMSSLDLMPMQTLCANYPCNYFWSNPAYVITYHQCHRQTERRLTMALQHFALRASCGKSTQQDNGTIVLLWFIYFSDSTSSLLTLLTQHILQIIKCDWHRLETCCCSLTLIRGMCIVDK